MAEPAAGRVVLQRGAAISAALAEVGVAMPVPIPELSRPERAVVVSAFIPGRSGMELIGSGQGAGRVGQVVGEAWLALGRAKTAGLGLDDLWARPSDLVAAALRWLAAAGPSVDPSVSVDLRRRIDELPRLLAGRRPGLVHGDLVPANVLVKEDQLAALLDLETMRVGERLVDAAWFRWIVRYHHPEVEREAWSDFARVTGVDAADATVGSLLGVLPIVRILEILGQPTLAAAARERWLDQLRACARNDGAAQAVRRRT
jgi:Ser/Thr protein kinase RdoA (MazF antagonist)